MGDVVYMDFSRSKSQKTSENDLDAAKGLFGDIIEACDRECRKSIERGREGFDYVSNCRKINKPQLWVLLNHLKYFAGGISIKSAMLDMATSHSNDYAMLNKWSVSRDVKEMEALINSILNEGNNCA